MMARGMEYWLVNRIKGLFHYRILFWQRSERESQSVKNAIKAQCDRRKE